MKTITQKRHDKNPLKMSLPYVQRRNVRPIAPKNYERVVDLFAGWGGASIGIEAADEWAVDFAVNHSTMAVEAHKINHPYTRHLCEDVFDVDPLKWFSRGQVGLLWASPDCTHFSLARGSRPKSKKIRSLASRVLYWAKYVRPRVIMLENVKEFKTWCRLKSDGQPDFSREGEYFRTFTRWLQRMGYAVEFRVLNAADYGAPTARHRLFMIARCDGQPIIWPEPTHGPECEHPYHTAAECIDWSIPCPSIFETSQEIFEKYHIRAVRPLAENTLRRIARGMDKYVINAAEPFIVRTGHYSNITGKGDTFRGQSVDEPLATVCSVNDKALVVPTITGIDNKSSNGVWDGNEPLRTITSENCFALTSFVAKNYGGVVGQDTRQPLGTITSIDHNSLVSAFLSKYHTAKGNESRCYTPDESIATLDGSNRVGLVAANLAKFRGDSAGGDLRDPLPTITAGGKSKRPAGHPHAMGVIAANMVSLRHGEAPAFDCNQPMRTICAQGTHHALVASFMMKYYGQGCGQVMTDPLGTITGRDRFGVVTVNIKGEPYVITDIGMRMLQPHELLKAQFGEFAEHYVMVGTNSQKVAGIGNSVCPHVARALVAANFTRRERSL